MGATLQPPRSELDSLEERAAEHLSTEHLDGIDADLIAEEQAAAAATADQDGVPAVRYAIAVGATTLACAVMVGGIFVGISPRIYAAIGGALGIVIAVFVSRIRRPLLANVLILLGLFSVGALFVLPAGPDRLPQLSSLVRQAISTGDVTRPPVEFLVGWRVVLGWLMGLLGFAGAWTAIAFKRPSIGLFLPLPALAIAGISVPESQQIPSAIAALALFAVALGLLSSTQAVGEGDDRPPASYEIRRALRALPLVVAITVVMYFLAQTNFLFPEPRIDPTQEAQKPKTVPLSEVEDRPLFTVESVITGPWRMGALDVYDGEDWRLPPFSQNKVGSVPESGVVDKDLEPGVKAAFTVKGLSGAVLPGLPNTVGIKAKGPELAYDARNGNIRLVQGAITPGVGYTVTAAGLPSVDELRAVTAPLPSAIAAFTEIPDPPPGVQSLLDQAPTANKWDQVDFLRTWVLKNVTSAGAGTPVSISPERAQEIITTTQEATPYEIVALQAMLARWVGVPSRIGYGFDGGEELSAGIREIRPRNGATFVEFYFPGFKWLPVIGTPEKAKPTVGNTDETQSDPNILPSDEIGVQVFLPVVIAPPDPQAQNIRRALLAAVVALLVIGLLYVMWPAVYKAIVRGRRRSRSVALGASSRIALAYSEWRDHATDFGYRNANDTPLMFLDRFTEDAEHTELAWLVTRSLWGDMQNSVTSDHAAAAEELSRALRKRLSDAHPITVRLVSTLSRLSLRQPYSTEDAVLGKPKRAKRSRKEVRRVQTA